MRGHPLRLGRLGELFVHAVLLRPGIVQDVRAQARLMVAGAGIADPAVILAAVFFQTVIVHGALGLIAAISAFYIQRAAVLIGGGKHGKQRVVDRLAQLKRAADVLGRHPDQIGRNIGAIQQVFAVGQADIIVWILQDLGRDGVIPGG